MSAPSPLRSSRIGLLAKVLFAAWALGAVGCASVAPYERGRLSERAMQLDPDPLWSDVEEHNHAYREGAAGGFGGGGGGCGCN